MVMIAMRPQACGLTLAEGKLSVIEMFRHMCHFLSIKAVPYVGRHQGVPRFIGQERTASPSREGGFAQTAIANAGHHVVRSFLREPRKLRVIFDTMFEVINDL